MASVLTCSKTAPPASRSTRPRSVLGGRPAGPICVRIATLRPGLTRPGLMATRRAAPVVAAAAQAPVVEQEPWTKPAPWNSTEFRATALATVVALAVYNSHAHLSQSAFSMATLVCFSCWFGSAMWVTFVAGLVMFKNLPRQTFGRLQAKLFPWYFSVSTVFLSVLVALSVAKHGAPPPSLLVALGCTLLNLVVVEPVTTESMLKRYELENKAEPTEAEIKQIATLRKQFGMMHGLSSASNLAAICGGVYFLWGISCKMMI